MAAVVSGGALKQAGSYSNTAGNGSVVIVPAGGVGANGQMYMSVGPQLSHGANQGGLNNAQLQMSAGHNRQ